MNSSQEYPTHDHQQQLHISRLRIVELAEGDRPDQLEDKHLYECLDCLRLLNEEMKHELMMQQRRKGRASEH